MMHRFSFVCLAVFACSADIGELDHHDHDEPPFGLEITNQTVADFERSTCSTAAVAPLSRQIAEEMLCMAPGVVARLEAGSGISFQSEAVLPYMDAEAAQQLATAARTTPITLNSGFRTVAQQYLLKAWRDRRRCNIKAAAPPGRSNHESARAVDVNNHGAARRALNRQGWKQTVRGDAVHFEFLKAPDLRGMDVHAFQRLWNRNHPEDPINEDGDFGAATEARLRRAPAGGFPIGPACGGQDSENFYGDQCESDAGCDLPSGEGTCLSWDSGAESPSGMCTDSCMGVCPQRVGEVTVFCAEVGQSEGQCFPVASDGCPTESGATKKPLRLYRASGVSSTVETVCVPPSIPGIACESGDASGECIDTSVQTCSGATVGGRCPGGQNIVCCIGESTVEPDPEPDPSPWGTCTVGADTGQCIDTNQQSCGGSVHLNQCPGGNNIRCCID